MKNLLGFDDLVRVEHGADYDTLFIGRDGDPMQVSRRFPPGNDANILCGAIQRALAEVSAKGVAFNTQPG